MLINEVCSISNVGLWSVEEYINPIDLPYGKLFRANPATTHAYTDVQLSYGTSQILAGESSKILG